MFTYAFGGSFLIQEPVQVCLGTRRVTVGERTSHLVKEAQDKYIYIPILSVLSSLLKCPMVYEEVK